jgi:NADPH-dependent curcumin reductase CurA
VTRNGKELRLVRRPQGRLDAACFEVAETTIPDPADGEVLVRNLWLSIDAAVRVRLAESTPDGYLPPIGLHQPLVGLAVGEIVASRAAGFVPGDVVTHALGYRDFALVRPGDGALAGAGGLSVVDTTLAPPEAYLGILGHIGLTAYAGLLHVADLREGDVVWVSAAAGAVGSVAAQLAKCWGHTVVGSTGSPQKVRYLLEDLGLDAAFDHHDGHLPDLLRAAAPSGIDVYFDNVGGAHLEAALTALRDGGRVALCGAVSEYGAGPSQGPGNMFQIVAKSLQLRGFRVGTFSGRTAETRTVLGGMLTAGGLGLREHVFEGLERAPEALVTLLSGGNTGKVLVRLSAQA